MLTRLLHGLLAAAAALAVVGASRAGAQTTQDLKRMSLQDLLDVEVTTVSRGPEPAALVPAAISVITRDDLRRSGAATLAQALQLVPGLQVARIDAGRWAIGSRGFADRLARSMLVLIDGRAVYSPLFAGTYWEVQDTSLADVERIEVIRGPGGTLWGANAVNGIINIITSAAVKTQGLLVDVGGGSAERGLATVRYGGGSDRMYYRVYGKGLSRGPEFSAASTDADHWHVGQAGFRADWTLARDRSFTIQGDAYDGRLGQRTAVTTYSPPYVQTSTGDAALAGGNLLARWVGRASGHGGFQLQAYYDVTSRTEVPVGERRQTLDVDFQHLRTLGQRHEITWGVGSRVTSGRISAVPPTAFQPDRRTDALYSAFAQDEILLVPGRFGATVGTKLEHNDYSGFELQPSARLLWTPQPAHTAFAAVTRAVRTPSRVETDYTTLSLAGTQPIPVFVRLEPNAVFAAERQVAYEAGYRLRPAAQAYLTFSGFFNDLANVLSTELLTPFVETAPAPAHVILPVQFGNGLRGSSHGAELTADVRPTAWWRVTANYSWLRIQLTRNAGSRDVSQEKRNEGSSPRHQVQVVSSLDLPGRWFVDAWLRHVSELPAGPVPAYSTLSARLAWQAAPGLELAVVGRNLDRAHHAEWTGGIEVQRSVELRLTWRR